MNREIEFRAWDVENKIMVYDNEDDSYGYWDGCQDSNIGMINHLLKRREYIFMQYTGLKDKNGKKIFEGDIVKYRSGGYGVNKNGKPIYKTKKYIIDYDTKMPMFYLKAKNEKDDEIIDIIDGKKDWIEVIGNIYENKELLGD